MGGRGLRGPLAPLPPAWLPTPSPHSPRLLQVEFNKAALSLAESFSNPSQKKSALNRLLKV